MQNKRGGKRPGAGRKEQALKKLQVFFYINADKAAAFKEEAQAIADRYNGAEKVIEAQPFADEAKKRKRAKKTQNEVSISEADIKKCQDAIFPPDKETEKHTREIEKQIAAIKAEKIPKERDTVIGRKVWHADQSARIADLQRQLK